MLHCIWYSVTEQELPLMKNRFWEGDRRGQKYSTRQAFIIFRFLGRSTSRNRQIFSTLSLSSIITFLASYLAPGFTNDIYTCNRFWLRFRAHLSYMNTEMNQKHNDSWNYETRNHFLKHSSFQRRRLLLLVWWQNDSLQLNRKAEGTALGSPWMLIHNVSTFRICRPVLYLQFANDLHHDMGRLNMVSFILRLKIQSLCRTNCTDR